MIDWTVRVQCTGFSPFSAAVDDHLRDVGYKQTNRTTKQYLVKPI
jgi:hypothetical protein